MRPDKYLTQLIFPSKQGRTKEIFKYNPTVQPIRSDANEIKIYVFNYNKHTLNAIEVPNKEACAKYINSETTTWINIDGLKKKDVEDICNYFNIHPLLVEDILSIGQRPKMDDIDGLLYCLLNMLYFNEKFCTVEQEQISIVLGENYVITFQEDASRDVFNGIREKLKLSTSKLRQRGADYLCYNLLDMIVDHYFEVMELLGDKIEALEDEIIRVGNTRSLAKINNFRKELIVLKRNIAPVRDLVNGFIKSESELVEERSDKYFRDVYDHIIQANEFVDNYRDMMTSLQDLYLSKVNLRLNEVMKVVAIVTCLLAPATVIGGIFGMNFDVIPYTHQVWGFYAAVGAMLIIPIIMLIVFKRRGWF